MKKSFQLYLDYRAMCDALSDEQAGQIFKAIFSHEAGEDVQLEGALGGIYILIANQLDRDRDKYEQTCKRNAENGKKGGRQKKRAVDLGTQQNPEKADTDKETDKETGTDHKDKVSVKASRYQDLFDHYLSLDLIRHQSLTPEMKNAVDVAIRRCGYTIDILKELLTRHAAIVEATKDNGELKVRKRSFTAFFGQKVFGGTQLICGEYADDGDKWLRFQEGGYKNRDQTGGAATGFGGQNCSAKRGANERPTENYDHLAVDLFADENKDAKCIVERR